MFGRYVPRYNSYPSYGYGNRYGYSSGYRWDRSGYDSGYGSGYDSPYYRNYRYGRTRRRPYYWERNRPWYDNYSRYRRSRYSPPPREVTAPSPPPEVPEVPEVPEEDLAKELFVKDVDLHIKENTKKHRTDEYTCTQGKDAELVVRRGDSVKMTITFDRTYSKEKNDLKLCFSLGPSPKANKGTLALFDIDESGKEKFASDKWGANLISRDDSKFEITVMVFIPAICIIGEWNFYVRTISEGKSEDGKPKTIVGKDFQLEDDITILFNPWCKDDPVYMSDEKLLEEYILNEDGAVWRNTYETLSPKPWNYGQFETKILDASFTILRLGFGDRLTPMSDPVKVSRMIAKMVNANNDKGVLVGKWSNDYSDGESPMTWVGSLKILRSWIKNGPVKYGQCWVFACVTTTVCRALGIPCRTVTNFESAHDSNQTNTIEFYFKPGPYGYDVLDENNAGNESIWNFHVWNEVWMSRNDLQDFKEPGWQVIDATPQESSDGYMQCGPCPVKAVKNGDCTVKYDCGFIFCEVNGDIIHWITYPDDSIRRLRIIKDRVGKKISTKLPGEAIERLDLTDEYKYKEGSVEERMAVMKAHETARFPNPDTYANVEKIKQIKFDLILRSDIMIGSAMPIKLVAQNESSADRKINKCTITVSQAAYTGHTGKIILAETFGPVTLKAGEEKVFEVLLHPDQYLEYLVELASISIVAEANVEPIGRDDEEEFYMKRAARFRRPDLKVEGPKTAKVGDVATFTVILINPLDKPLTKCKVSMESVGFDDFDLKAVENIKPKEVWKMEFPLKVVKATRHAAVYFSFECEEIPDISGRAIIKIPA